MPLYYMPYLADASNLKGSPGRKFIAAGVVGAVAVIALIVGVMFIQTGSSVSLLTTTSSLSTTSSTTSTRAQSTMSKSTTSSSTTSTTASAYSGPTGILGVSLTDPPIVPPGVSAVYITYSSVQVHVGDAGNQDGWYTVADAGSVDLMSLLNVSLTLGSAQVQTGVFNLISFNISSAAITLNGINQTAYVPANRISVPIVGGISVTDGNTSGVLVDLSPEVVPYQNGTSVSYVLVPEARSVPIPRYVWNYKLEEKGAKLTEIQNQTWVSQNAGQVVVSGVNISASSFSLTLKNEGTTNATFSSIVIGQAVQLPQCLASAAGRPAAPKPADNTSSPASYVSLSTQNAYYVGAQQVFLGGRVYPAPTSPNTSATLTVTDPNGVIVESANVSVELSGAFHLSFTAGGSTLPWVHGTYTAIAAYNGTSGRITFAWYPAQQQTTKSSVVTSSTEYHTSTTNESAIVITTQNETTATSESWSSTSTEYHGTMTILTNASSYFGGAGVLVNGTITPMPTAAGYFVAIRVISPGGQVVFVNEVPVSPDGTFNASFMAGGVFQDHDAWTNGTYKVYAYHEGGVYAATTFQWSGPAFTTTIASLTTETITDQRNSTQEIKDQIQNYFCSQTHSEDKLPPSIPVAYYAVFTNGTLYRVNYTSLILAAAHVHVERHDGVTTSITSTTRLGYTLMPGETWTFTFNGTVDSLSKVLLSYMPRNFAVPSSLFSINAGEQYTIVASGPFATRIATVTNATAIA